MVFGKWLVVEGGGEGGYGLGHWWLEGGGMAVCVFRESKYMVEREVGF